MGDVIRLAQIDAGRVVNVIAVDPAAVPDWAKGWPAAGDAGPGWAYDGVAFTPPAPAAPVLPDLSFAQAMIGLVAEGWITNAEGELWLQGMLPLAVDQAINGLPAAARFAARARATRPTTISATDPLVGLMAALQGKDAAEMAAFFTTYAAI
jgi:hypothetical protein